MLAPPSPGAHKLHGHGNLPLFNFALDITYNFTVAPGGSASTLSTGLAGTNPNAERPTWGKLKATYR